VDSAKSLVRLVRLKQTLLAELNFAAIYIAVYGGRVLFAATSEGT
jgi:hypothetical protein